MESFPQLDSSGDGERESRRHLSADAEAAGPSTPGAMAAVPTPPRTPTPAGSPSPKPVDRTTSTMSQLSRIPSTGTSLIRPQSMRIRRLPSTPSVPQLRVNDNTIKEEEEPEGRRRSLSAPQAPGASTQSSPPLNRQGTSPAPPGLASVAEEATNSSQPQAGGETQADAGSSAHHGRLRAASDAARSFMSGGRSRSGTASSVGVTSGQDDEHYSEEVADLLDVVDAEVSTLTTLNNVQNTLFIPYLGSYFNKARQPTYHLTPQPLGRQQTRLAKPPDLSTIPTAREDGLSRQPTMAEQEKRDEAAMQELVHQTSITSVMSERNYAVLPHGTILQGWSDEDKAALNDYVRHCLHSRRAKFKRSMKGFWKYVQKPTGFLVTLYASLLFLFGLSWVLFLIGWIYVGSRQKYLIEVCDQVLTALFAVVGIGLAPFRAVDTYHMVFIVHYHFITWRIRRKRGLPELVDPNELPDRRDSATLELGREKAIEQPVLTPEQQTKLEHHAKLFSRSHTFYKPHETYTHRAFSIHYLLAIVILFDCHSCLQMALGGTTWGIYYRVRPSALTATILSCSISCNITAGILISIGDSRARKKQVVERLFRQAITQEGIEMLEQERGLETGSRVATKKTPEQIMQQKDDTTKVGSKTAATHSHDGQAEEHKPAVPTRLGHWARKKFAV